MSDSSIRHPAIEGVLFDLDGTLADTALDLVAALNLSLEDRGFATKPLQAVRHAASHGSLALVRAAEPDLPLVLQQEIQQGLLTHYQRLNGSHCGLFDGMALLLEHLHANGIPWGIVTNKPARFTRPLMDRLGLTGQMRAIVSGDSTCYSKPHAAPMLLAAQQLGCAPGAILYLGDAERDLLAAQAAAMAGGVALWGYLGLDDMPSSWPSLAQFSCPQDVIDFLKAQIRR
jgi:N-acetyl-D-muramate 6-phosphate phosphatase